MSDASAKERRFGSLASLPPGEVRSLVDQYNALQDADLKRKQSYAALTNHYYDLATDFYEFGWGESFHFAPRRRGESFQDALLRHEYFLADRLALAPGMQVLDVGCGVGGPMANLARYSGSSFVGINNNAYQLERAKANTQDVQSLCRFIHGDFMRIPEPDNHIDAAFAIEATPHAPDKTAVFREIFRVLRPGACFAGYEWCMTEVFDPQDPHHLRIKEEIVKGNGIQDLALTSEVGDALRKAGFERIETCDIELEPAAEIPWYQALQGRDLGLSSIPRTPVGRALTNLMLRVGERLRLVPEATTAVSTILNACADAMVAGGELGIFTPVYFFLARKPQGPAEG